MHLIDYTTKEVRYAYAEPGEPVSQIVSYPLDGYDVLDFLEYQRAGHPGDPWVTYHKSKTRVLFLRIAAHCRRPPRDVEIIEVKDGPGWSASPRNRLGYLLHVSQQLRDVPCT